MTVPVSLFEERLKHEFRARELLERALSHRSWTIENPGEAAGRVDNEQLEFLGDAVLGFVVSEALVLAHPEESEGQLSKWKAYLVSSAHLYCCALRLELGSFLRLGRGEERNGGRERRNLLANALEAVIAALYLDAGIDVARSFIREYILSGMEAAKEELLAGADNYKSILQEHAQASGLPTPRYSIVGSSGPEHRFSGFSDGALRHSSGASTCSRPTRPARVPRSAWAARASTGRRQSLNAWSWQPDTFTLPTLAWTAVKSSAAAAGANTRASASAAPPRARTPMSGRR